MYRQKLFVVATYATKPANFEARSWCLASATTRPCNLAGDMGSGNIITSSTSGV